MDCHDGEAVVPKRFVNVRVVEDERNYEGETRGKHAEEGDDEDGPEHKVEEREVDLVACRGGRVSVTEEAWDERGGAWWRAVEEGCVSRRKHGMRER